MITATRKEKLFGLIFLVVIGAGLIGISCYETYKAYAAKSWPRKTATIIESRLDNSFQGGKSRQYILLKGAYDESGESFRISRIAYGIINPDPSEILRKYPKGKKLAVYVNPDDFTDLVLEVNSGVTAMQWVLFTGCGLILLAVLGIFTVKEPVGERPAGKKTKG